MSVAQVRALAAVYGLEARACGRTGQTLFQSSHAGLPSAEGRAQVRSLWPAGLTGNTAEMDSSLQEHALMPMRHTSLPDDLAGILQGCKSTGAP